MKPYANEEESTEEWYNPNSEAGTINYQKKFLNNFSGSTTDIQTIYSGRTYYKTWKRSWKISTINNETSSAFITKIQQKFE